MSNLDDLKNKYRRDTNQTLRRAVLGDSLGNIYDTSAYNNGRVLVRDIKSTGDYGNPYTVAINAAYPVPMVPGTPVSIGWFDNQDTIMGVDNAGAMATGLNPIANLVPPTTITPSRLVTLLVETTDPESMQVTINQWEIIVDATAYSIPTQVSADFTSLVPTTTDYHCYIVLFVLNDYATIGAVTSTPKIKTELLTIYDWQEALTTANGDSVYANATAFWAIRLYEGMTTITDQEIYIDGVDLRQVINTRLATAIGTIPLPIDHGGTNAITKTAAFDNLSPLGTVGDMLWFDGGHNVAVGNTGYGVTPLFNTADGSMNSYPVIIRNPNSGLDWANEITAQDDNTPLTINGYSGGSESVFVVNGNTTAFVVNPSGDIYQQLTNTSTNTVDQILTLDKRPSSGTPAAGYGMSIRFELKSSTSVGRNAGLIVSKWSTATDASRIADMVFYSSDSGADREVIHISSSGSAGKFSVFGQTPAIQQTGGSATAGGTYGATEQTMLQKIYDMGRTFGFLS